MPFENMEISQHYLESTQQIKKLKSLWKKIRFFFPSFCDIKLLGNKMGKSLCLNFLDTTYWGRIAPVTEFFRRYETGISKCTFEVT